VSTVTWPPSIEIDAHVRAVPLAVPRHNASRALAAVALLVIVGIYIVSTIGALRQTSTTFDEIVHIAGGARGYATGTFDLSPEHPPLMYYIYGLPVHLSGAQLPELQIQPVRGELALRYLYAQHYFWQSGNDPERLAFLARLPAVFCGVIVILLAFVWVRRTAGPGAAVIAALLVAFLPDLLAHGGVAYNDVPLAAAYLGALWAIDAALRRPTLWRGAIAGALIAIAMLIKFSAVALLPAAALLLGLEMVRRVHTGDLRTWLPSVATAACTVVIAGYLTLVGIYRGEWSLDELRYGVDFIFGHVNRGHGVPAYLLGQTSVTGWWYFYPVAFLFKTPVALHVLGVLALGVAAHVWRSSRGSNEAASLASSSLRMPLVGILVFGAALMASSLNIGFRYALPVLPLVCMVIAIGVAGLWKRSARGLRVMLAALLVWYAASSLSVYPNFLSYTSEYVADRHRGDRVLLDSSLDWGQGLLQLRAFMARHDIDRVFLSYFGSALPAGYGIDYELLPSFFRPPPQVHTGEAKPDPRYVVISATNLHGIYLPGDPFARFREIEPDFVVARSLFVYRIHD
jgi:4-amino-4-deoxy-L-arabinose transferase-like glycosyltransferase